MNVEYFRALAMAMFFFLLGCSTNGRVVDRPSAPVMFLPEQSVDARFESVVELVGREEESDKDVYFRERAAFLNNRDYACRHPLYANYFQQRENGVLADKVCSQKVPLMLSSGLEVGSIVWLNPDRVHAVHLLFAGKGEAMMSRFGHIAFRLIVCPEEDRSAEACESNLYEHLVLGYMAHVDTFSISPLKGFFGGYRAHLVAGKFMDAYEQYAIGEFRDIYSLPLEMDKDDIRFFVRALSEVHWSYSGEYRFITRNCSTMAQRLLAAAWTAGGESEALDRVRWRPDKFFKVVRQSSLANSMVIENKNEAEKAGFYFPSTLPAYEMALAMVADAREGESFDSIDDYVRQSPEKRLSEALSDKAYYRALEANPRLLSGQIMLEELSFLRAEKRLQSELANWFDKNGMKEIRRSLREAMNAQDYSRVSMCLLDPVSEYLRPARRYQGIPVNKLEARMAAQKKCEHGALQYNIQKVRQLFMEVDSGWARVEVARYHWEGSLHNVDFLTRLEGQVLNRSVSLH